MAKGTNGDAGEPEPPLTREEIWAKFTATNSDGKTLAERFAAAARSFIVPHGAFFNIEFANIPLWRVRVAGNPMTEAEAACIDYRRALGALARGDGHSDNHDSGSETLEHIKASLNGGKEVESVTVRELLRWFGAERREDQIAGIIQRALRKHNLRTEPDFAEHYVNGTVEFRAGSRMTDREAGWLDYFQATLIKSRVIDQYPGEPTFAEVWTEYDALMKQTKIEDFSEEEVEAAHVALSVENVIRNGYEPEIAADLAKALHAHLRTGGFAGWISYRNNLMKKRIAAPVFGKVILGPWQERLPEEIKVTTFRVRGLEAANKPVVSVKPNDSITEAIALMRSKGFSQIPVMRTERDVKGVISWRSIVAHQRLPTMQSENTNLDGQAQEYMERSWSEVKADGTLLEAIDAIEHSEYVLVRKEDNSISGIVTNSDLSRELRQRSEPFLLINQIENHVKNLILQHFSDQELRDNFPDGRYGKPVDSVFDLTFDGYTDFLRRDKNWTRLKLSIGQNTFISYLAQTGKIRNDVMHFRVDEIAREKLELLREFLRLLEYIEPMVQ